MVDHPPHPADGWRLGPKPHLAFSRSNLVIPCFCAHTAVHTTMASTGAHHTDASNVPGVDADVLIPESDVSHFQRPDYGADHAKKESNDSDSAVGGLSYA